MPAGIYDFTCDQGETFTRRLRVTIDSDNSPFDLSSSTAKMHIRPRYISDNPMIEATTENGGITLGGAAGTIDIAISSTDTGLMTKPGVYDLEIIDANGEVNRLLKGKFVLRKAVTHD